MRPGFARTAPDRPSARASVELVVPFHDVDSLRIVWHGHYLKYMELARTALLRGVGLDAEEVHSGRYGFLIVESACRHVSPLRYGDRVRVDAWVRDVRYRIHVAYEITNLTTGRRAARAYTILVTMDPEGRMLLTTPESIVRRLEDAAAEGKDA
jgi:acyl-CoA thioester hydrolase